MLEALKILSEYGIFALVAFAAAVFLLRFVLSRKSVWAEKVRRNAEQNEVNLANHQFFTGLSYKLKSEVPTMTLAGMQPVRQQIFRDLLRITLTAIDEIVRDILTTNMDNMTPSEWAAYVHTEMAKIDDEIRTNAAREGMPDIIVTKYIVWKMNSVSALTDYVNDLAISTVYATNLARMNTLLYLLNLKLITVVGDAEQTLSSLNGEITGLSYKGSIIE